MGDCGRNKGEDPAEFHPEHYQQREGREVIINPNHSYQLTVASLWAHPCGSLDRQIQNSLRTSMGTVYAIVPQLLLIKAHIFASFIEIELTCGTG